MGEVLKRQYVDNVYTLEGASAWICAGDHDIWIIKGMTGVSVTMFNNKTDEVVDAMFIMDKGEAK